MAVDYVGSCALVLLVADRIIAGFGFTAEPDFLHIVRRRDGEVLQRISIASGHDTLRVDQDGVLIVGRYHKQTERFVLRGFDGEAPSLVPHGD